MGQLLRHVRRHLSALWVGAALCLCISHGAWAASPETERAEAKVIEAKAFFKSALYQDAAASYLQAFAISKKPATLFNAARAYEEAKLYAQAIALFEQYVQLPDTPADGRREANERIAHGHELLAANRAPVSTATAVKPPETKAEEVRTEEAKAVETHPANPAPPAVNEKPAEAPAERKSSWVDWALFAGGDTLVLVGLLGYVGAVNTVNQANAMDFSALNAEANYKTQLATARSARTSSAIVAVVGVGLAGWGAWRLWGPRADAPAKTTSWITPTVAPDLAGVVWGGRF